MKKNNLFKNAIAISVCFGAMVLLGTSSSKAVLQANGNDGATYNLSDWMMNVRKMEELGGAMGLSESINDNLTSSSSSNNIDVHMQKNTEYGALAILSASSYGNPNKINSGETTTGNATGVVMKFNNEWTAAGSLDSKAINLKNSVNRYKNLYTTTYVAKKGDAMEETKNWHGAYSNVFFGGAYGILRNLNESIFSYDGGYYTGYGYDYTQNAYFANLHYSRAVVVQGDGI